MALAVFRKAIFSRELPLGMWCESTFPPLILLFGASLSHAVNCLAVGNFRIPSSPLSLYYFLQTYQIYFNFQVLVSFNWVIKFCLCHNISSLAKMKLEPKRLEQEFQPMVPQLLRKLVQNLIRKLL